MCFSTMCHGIRDLGALRCFSHAQTLGFSVPIVTVDQDLGLDVEVVAHRVVTGTVVTDTDTDTH